MLKRNSFLLGMTLALASLTTGCLSSILDRAGDKRSKDYTFVAPGSGWEKIDPAEADAAYKNSKDHAILNITSVCGDDRFRSLEELSDDLLSQLPDRTLTEPPKATQINGNPGLVSEARGTMDGQPLNVRVAVIRSQRCLYDLILAGAELDKSSRAAFDQALAGFKEGSKR